MKKLLSAAAALACGATLAVAGAGPAQASTGGCSTNSFCLYSETQYQSQADVIFNVSGTEMFNHPNVYYYSEQLKHYQSVYIVNRTQGYFCTYNASRTLLGRFQPGADRPIEAGYPYGTNWQVLYVKYCQNG